VGWNLALAGVHIIGVSAWLALDCSSAGAAAQTWDPSGGTVNFGGGGTWDPSSSNWWNGTMAAAWVPGNDAWFTGPTAGATVTLDAPQSVGNLVFSTSGYVLSGNTLDISPVTTTTITVNQNATINSSIIDGGNGLTFLGPGMLTLGAANTGLTGVVTVNGGTLSANGGDVASSTLGAATSIIVNSGATVLANGSNSLIGVPPTAGNTIQIVGGLLVSPSTNGSVTNHLNALALDGGTLSAASANTTWGSWNFDYGVSTPGDGKTSYMLGGNAVLTQTPTANGTQFNVGAGDTLYVGTALSLVSSLTFDNLVNVGAGTLVLAGSNNFNSTTMVNNGTLVLANTAAILASLLNISGGNVTFNGITHPVPVVSLTGNSGTLVLANTNGSPVNLSVGGGGASTTYSGVLTGSGSLTVTGGNLTLGGGNNYNATILAGGILTVGSPTALGSGAITFSGGTLQYNSNANPITDYSPQFSQAASQKFYINTGGQTVTYASNLKSTGGSLDKLGTGLLILSGPSNGYGNTAIDGGLLEFGTKFSIPSGSQIDIDSGGALVASSTFNLNTVSTWLASGKIIGSASGAIALTSSSTDTTPSTSDNFSSYPNLSLGVMAGQTVTYAGTITPGGGGYVLGGGGGTLVLSTALTGSTNNLTVGNGGGGTVVLANSSDNWGGTTNIVPGGSLQLGDGAANLVTPTGAITNNGTLLIPNALPQTIAAGLSGSGALYAFGSSVLTLGGTNSTGIFYANGGTVNINGSFSTTGKTVLGSNLASATPGPTVVNWNATGSATGGSFFGVADTGQTATLNVNGGSLAIANVKVFVGNTNGGGVGTLNMSAGTVTVDGSSAFYIGDINTTNNGSDGVVNINGGLLSIASGGTNAALGGNGAITMAYGSNSTATINLNGGVLSTGRSFCLGNGSAATLNLNGGTLQATANGNGNWFQGITVMAGSGGAVIDTQSYTMTVAVAETISGPGSLTKYGVGALVMDGINGYTGGTVINSGLVFAQSELSLGPVPSNFIYNNITLNGGELRDNANGVSLSLSANRGIYLGPAGGVLRAGWSNTTTVAGVVSGGSLTIANDGQGYPGNNVYLANSANTYTGPTTIGGGALPSSYDYEGLSTLDVAYLANGGQNSSIGASSNAAANLVFNAYNPNYASSSGTGTLNYAGTGDSTDRLFTIASGSLVQINNVGMGPLNFTNTGAIAISNNPQAATVALGGAYNGSTPNSFAPQIVDGAFPTTLQVNSSLWAITGSTNTYSGGTVLIGGTLLVPSGNQQALQNSIVTVNGGILAFDAGVTSPAVAGLAGTGSITLADTASNPVTLTVGGNGASSVFAGNLSGPGGLVKTGAGLLQLMASQSYSGPTTVLNGTLKMGTANDVTAIGPIAARYTFNGTANDSSGNELNATLVGGPSYTAGLFGGKAIALNGSSQYVAVPYNPALALNAYTVSLWVDVASQPAVNGNGGPALLGTRNGGNDTFDLQYVQLTTGGYELHGDIGTGSAWLTTAANYNLSGPLSGWNMITYAVNSSGYSIYVNGAQEATGNYIGTPLLASSAETLAMGSQEAGGSSYGDDGWLNGSLENVMIFGSALNASQIASLYTGQFGQLPAASPARIASGGTLDIGFNQTVASLSDVSGAGGTVTTSVAGSAALMLDPAGGSTTYSGMIINGSGTLALTMDGSGAQVLAGTNTYTGGTIVEAGALIATNSEALADGSSLFVGSAFANGSPFDTIVPAAGAASAAAAPAPEPSSLALLAAGALAVLAWNCKMFDRFLVLCYNKC
jgi:fibronectin-binding autotransporter adhesin